MTDDLLSAIVIPNYRAEWRSVGSGGPMRLTPVPGPRVIITDRIVDFTAMSDGERDATLADIFGEI